ncbi:hypothetical protein SAMD00023353_0701300 [Rosellinia necatrix]|uniref:Uncharacterized protein n=1 Tax=Rosellinia necatrix TaxID=77044 RepID=A0A1S7ULU9_ROSNE|nr:hypothetical protein SAMD00023353_0701300 [Rosellinia necatrix]
MATTSKADSTGTSARYTQPTPVVRRMMAEMQVSLTTNQLSEQVRDSIAFWRKFRDEYSMEVDSIRSYVGVDILQQIWQKKAEFHSTYKRRDKQDGQQFIIQRMKLESCLNQLNEATQLLVEAWSSYHIGDYDPRQQHSIKLRATSNFVISLSKRSAVNEVAGIDLLEELAGLEKLINVKSPAASITHHPGRRQSQDPLETIAEEGEIQGARSRKPENGDIGNRTGEGSSNWAPGNREGDWPGSNDKITR